MIDIRDGQKILNTEIVGDLFSNDINKIKDEYKKLAKIWHPDINKDKNASDIFAKISELYNAALAMIENGKWEKSNYIIINKSDGKKIALNYYTKFEFELGICYVCKTKVIYVLDKDKEKYYNNAVRSIKAIKYKDKKMEEDLSRFMPKMYDNFKTSDGECVLVLEKTEDVYPLKNVHEYFSNSIEDKHVAWIISRLYNIACFLKFSGIVHNGININNCFISPEFHSIILLGGWWYTTEEDAKMIGTTKDIFSIMSVSVKGEKTSNSLTDLESIKLLGRELLGETNCRKLALNKSVPKPFINFLISGSIKDSFEEFNKWDKALNDSYGKRKFIKMEVKDLYSKK